MQNQIVREYFIGECVLYIREEIKHVRQFITIMKLIYIVFIEYGNYTLYLHYNTCLMADTDVLNRPFICNN